MMPSLRQQRLEIQAFDFSNKPKMSVNIITWQRADTLERVLPSILGQHLPAYMYELVIIDDSGFDNTLNVVKKMRYLYPHHCIRYILIDVKLKEPRQPGFAMNVGARQSRNDILMVQASDILHIGETLWLHYKEFADDIDSKNIRIPVGCWNMNEKSIYWGMDLKDCGNPEYTFSIYDRAVRGDNPYEITYEGIYSDLKLTTFRKKDIMAIRGFSNENHMTPGGEQEWWNNSLNAINVKPLMDLDGGEGEGIGPGYSPGILGRFQIIHLPTNKYWRAKDDATIFHRHYSSASPGILTTNPDDNWGHGGHYPGKLAELGLPPIKLWES